MIEERSWVKVRSGVPGQKGTSCLFSFLVLPKDQAWMQLGACALQLKDEVLSVHEAQTASAFRW